MDYPKMIAAKTKLDHSIRRSNPTPLHGQSLLEFALLLPVLFLILFGVLDLGRLFFANVTITNASREAARFAVGNPTNLAGIRSRAVNESSGIVIAPNVTSACAALAQINQSAAFTSANCATASTGDPIRVTVTARFQFATLYLFASQAITLTGSTTMAITNAP
jgi:Flp pilus assembly protein TadG